MILTGTFTVPKDISLERVREKAPNFIKKYVEFFEQEGYHLKSKVLLERSRTPFTEDIMQGENRFFLRAWWEKRPEKITLEVDEKLIPALIQTGQFQCA